MWLGRRGLFSATFSWSQVEAILGEHGVVCVSREGDSVRELLFSDDVLNRHQVLMLNRNQVLKGAAGPHSACVRLKQSVAWSGWI